MLCEHCSQNDATIHLTQVVDGAVKKLHLCESCAAKSGFDIHGSISITDLLLGMGGPQSMAKPPVRATDAGCPGCGMRLAQFKKSGRLGCPACYETFAAELQPLIRAMHRSGQHKGKTPSREDARVRCTEEIAQLQAELKKAVADEHFEEAARLRDRIQTCRAALGEAGP